MTVPETPETPTEPAAISEDRPILPGGAPAELTAWFEAHHVTERDWQPFVETIPMGRIYDVADASRRCSESWRAFAVALEDRARRYRR